MRIAPPAWFVVVLCAVLGCGGGEPDPANDTSDVAARAGNRDACRLLTLAEVEALLEQKVASASLDESMREYAKCQWKDEHGVYLFGIEVWWAGGKQQWDIWGQAMQQANAITEQQEGVSIDSVVTQGPVAGIGDGAIFSDVMPSRILSGDRFIEMGLVMVPNSAAKFRGLAQTLLSRM
jgi:hypothetical protein